MFFFESSDQTFGTLVSYSVDMVPNLDPDICFLGEKFLGAPNISIWITVENG
jgi:hypothetical protein